MRLGALTNGGGRLSILAIWAALAVLALHLSLDLRRSYADAQEWGSRLATSYVGQVAEHAAATFDRADLILERAVLLPGPADPAAARSLAPARRDTLESAMIALQAKAQGIVAMSMTDADGAVFANTVGTPPGGQLGDRGYFLMLKNGDSAGPVISEVVKGRVSRKWGVPVARRITAAGGGFGGVVVANIGMTDYVEKFFQSLALPPGSILALRDMGHRQLVSYPAAEDSYGKVVLSYAAVRLFDGGATEGSYMEPSAADGVMRIVAVRKLPGYDIYAVAAIPLSRVLDAWTRSRDQAVTLFLLALVAAVAATLLSSSRQRLSLALKARIAVQESVLDALSIPIFVRDKAGGFTACNTAYERYFGTPQGEVAGKTVFELLPSPSARSCFAADQEVLAGAGGKTYEITVRRADGSHRRVMVDQACYRDGGGAVAGVVGTVVDITDPLTGPSPLGYTTSGQEGSVQGERAS